MIRLSISTDSGYVRIHHHADQPPESHFRLPPQLETRFGRPHAALRTEVIDFVGTNCPDDLVQRARIAWVAINQAEPCFGIMRVAIEVIDPRSVETTRPADYAVNI